VRADLSRIYASLHGMHHEARTALVLHRVEGMSLPEAAQTMGISLSTIKRRIQSAERVLHNAAREEAL
jgi:DNA-directed RNA polymerase specialized sigma24 family protein